MGLNSKILIGFLIIGLIFLNGCGCIIPEQKPEDIAKGNEIVRQFLQDYPNAEIIVTHFEESAFENIEDELKRDCNTEFVEPKDYYRVKVIDRGTGLHVTTWINWETRQIECVFKKEREEEPEPPPICIAKWKCKDSYTKAYQKSDCTWRDEERCEFGCSNGECVEAEDPCYGVDCNNYCVASTRFYNGRCAEGECTYTSMQCPYGCENGVCLGDPCTGVECPNYCEGNTRFYNGRCIDGDCTYSSTQCPYGCSNGQCQGDPCAGVTCPDVCDGKTRKYDGSCIDGDCVYSTEECDYSCEDAACVEDPCAGVDCPDYCDDDTLYHDGTCIDGDCHYSTTDCTVDTPYCEDEWNLRTGGYCEDAECHYEGLGCLCGCENGDCRDPAELCEGVTCYDSCEDGIYYYDGYCNCGECTYPSSAECVFGCEDEWGCIPETDAMMFITSERWTGNLGGIIGADIKCEIAAEGAGLPPGWIALISDSFNDAISRPEFPDTIFRRMDGSIVAMSKAQLFDGGIDVSINIDEYGVTHTEVGQPGATWTGTKPDGTAFTGTYGGILVTNCDDWYNGANDYYLRGIGGDIQETNNYWIDDHTVSNVLYCSNVQRLYCVHTSV